MSLLQSLTRAAQGLIRMGEATNALGLQQIRTKWTNWHQIKDHKRRMITKQFAVDRVRLNTIKRNNVLPVELREQAAHELHNNFPRDSCFVRIRERCMITSRPRGCVKRFRLSRIMFRHLADYNKLSGVQRAMW